MPSIAIYAISFALVLNMAGYLSVAAVLPHLLVEWQMSETEAGILASCHMGVYAIAAMILLPLTDRLDTKRIILASLVWGVVGGFGFAWFADDFWSGLFFRSMVGIAQAGVYMPGLKLLADELEGPTRNRATALYSSMVPLGSGLSLLLPTLVPVAAGWQPIFEVTGIAGLAALALVAALVPRGKPHARRKVHAGNPYIFGPVLRNREAMRYILGYAGHVWETFGFRVWIVAFLLFASGPLEAQADWLPNLTVIAALIVIAAMPASILVGNWSVIRDRRQVLRRVGLASIVTSMLLAGFTDAHLYVVIALVTVYGVIGFADQGALGSAVVDAAEPEHRGTTLAVYTLFGFGFGMMGAVACGAVLEATGGIADQDAWRRLWLTCGVGSLLLTMLMRAQTRVEPLAIPVRPPRSYI